jgi:hypothetical protein
MTADTEQAAIGCRGGRQRAALRPEKTSIICMFLAKCSGVDALVPKLNVVDRACDRAPNPECGLPDHATDGNTARGVSGMSCKSSIVHVCRDVREQWPKLIIKIPAPRPSHTTFSSARYRSRRTPG